MDHMNKTTPVDPKIIDLQEIIKKETRKKLMQAKHTAHWAIILGRLNSI